MVKKLLVALIFSNFLVVTGWAATPNPSVIATPPQPKWNELTAQQKSVLAPLGGDWDAMEYHRRKKWIGIALRFPDMAPDEQRRIQGQMQEWAKLSPEQRRLAREKYQAMNQLPTDKKQELKQKWEEYSNLPADEKEKLQQQTNANPQSKPGRAIAAGVLPSAAVATPKAGVATPAANAPADRNTAVDAPQSTAADAPADTSPRP
jgi:hypothetical protein